MINLLNKVYKYDDVIPATKPLSILKATDLRDIKMVIVGQDPYSTGVIEFDKFKLHYDGLAFSSKNTMVTPYSLKIMNNWFVNTERMFNRKGKNSNSLYYLLDRGVLLINTIWAVRYGKPLSLAFPEWYAFTGFLLRYIQSLNEEVCFLLLGGEARKLSSYIDLRRHNLFTEMHPAASRYKANKNLYYSNVLYKCLKKVREPLTLLKDTSLIR